MRSERAKAVRLALVSVMTLVGTSMSGLRTASAYCRTTTAKLPADYQPPPGECFSEGLPVWWRNSCVGYSVQRDASRQVSRDDASLVLATAFTRWTNISCPTDGRGTSRVSIDVRDLGFADCRLVEFNKTGPNQHVIVFRDDNWPHQGGTDTLALTTVSFNDKTGELLNADMELNTVQNRVSIADPVPSDGYDLASILTHEAGHFFGLAHSAVSTASMFARYNPGETAKRNLAPDDVEGICAIYPPDGTRVVADTVDPTRHVPGAACDPTPRRGFTTQCADAVAKGGCAVTPCPVSPVSSSTPWGSMVVGAFAMGMAFRRVARSRRSPARPPSRSSAH
ncbi:MAG: matrixin family metalloprotease [Polyangiaceae bacterium]